MSLADVQTPDGYNGVKSTDVYAVNPLYRLRNEHYGVHQRGWQVETSRDLTHLAATISACFDGKRTIEDVARLAIPLVRNTPDKDPLQEADHYVRLVVKDLNHPEKDEPGGPHHFVPSEALLVPASLLPQFRGVPRPTYAPHQFFPANAAPAYDPARTIKTRVPDTLTWHLTSDCSVDCRYCYLGRRHLPAAERLSKQRVMELLQEASELGVFEIVLTGGDVLLCPHLLEVLEMMNDYAFQPVELSTKSFLSKDMAKALAKIPIVWQLQFSLDSMVPDVADWLVQRPGQCQQILPSIDNALEAGLEVTAKAVITPYNVLTAPQLYRDLRKRGVAAVRLATYCRSGHHHSDDLFNTAESMKWLSQQLDVLRKEFPGDFVNLQNGLPTLEPASKESLKARWPERAGCSAGRRQMMVCADGKVIPCEQMPETEETFCGDLKHQSIAEVWNGKLLDEKAVHLPREKFKGTVCYDCEERIECHHQRGYCYRNCCILYGTMYAPAETCPKNDRPFTRWM